MGNLYCPYCDEDLGGYVDDCHEPNVDYEHECCKCEKKFMFTIEYYPSYTSNKADCLNDSEHSYEKICGYPKEFFKNKRRCSMCNKEIILEKDALNKNGEKHGK